MKVTSACTLRCNYCQYLSHLTGDNSNLVMSRDTMHKSILQLLSLPSKRITFIWHGGEPLLVGMNFYEDVISFQKQVQREGQKIRNNIQTNGTLLSQEWIGFLRENQFNIGISLDGPSKIHNYHRLYPSGNGSFNRVMKSANSLMANELAFGLLAVVTKEHACSAKEIYDFFVGHNFKTFDFLPCIEINKDEGKTTGSSITAFEFADFMIQVFDLWMDDDDPKIHIRYFDNILNGLLGGKPTLCKFAGTCSSFLTIDCNGDIYPCDSFVGYYELRFGNILTDDLQTVIESDKYKDFAGETKTIHSECSECEWYQVCHGGCSYYRYMTRQDFSDENYFCKANKTIFRHIEERVKDIVHRAV